MPKPRVLLVEDDESLGYILSEYLGMTDFAVKWVRDGEEGWKVFQRDVFDICILDIMMPKKDGLTLAKEIKDFEPNQPIVFLTAKALKIDKLKGFKAGCDDYIVKPVDEEELIARIQAIIRRSTKSFSKYEGTYQIGSYQFDVASQSLSFKGNRSGLTEKEAEILRLLCERKGEILHRKETLKSIWGENDYFSRRSMDVFVTKLRKMLSQDPRVRIRNVHGKGFILED